MNDLPLDEYGLSRRETMLRCGHTDEQVARLVETGGSVRIWPGMYLPATTSARFEARHRLQTIASMTTPDADAATVASHPSAATVHGLSMLKPDLSRVRVRNGLTSGG